MTGFATVPNGTAQVVVNTYASIYFSSASVDFGTGNVNATVGNCSVSTIPNWANEGCISFSKVNNGFTVENDGNTNLSIDLQSNVTGATFIGVTGPKFLWNVTVNESNSCYNVSNGRDNVVEPNTSTFCASDDNSTAANCGSNFESVSTSYKNVCPRLRYETPNDALNIDINVSIPSNAPSGGKYALLTIRGTTA